MPERIRMTRDRPWRADHPDAVIVDRRSAWGNPFAHARPPGYRHKVLCHLPTMTPIMAFGIMGVETSDPERRRHNAAVCFAAWLDGPTPEAAQMRARLPELRGRDLACWCPLDQECHADTLLDMANRETTG